MHHKISPTSPEYTTAQMDPGKHDDSSNTKIHITQKLWVSVYKNKLEQNSQCLMSIY